MTSSVFAFSALSSRRSCRVGLLSPSDFFASPSPDSDDFSRSWDALSSARGSPDQGLASEETMIMDGIETLSQVTLSGEAQPFSLSLSFDTYKFPSDGDDSSQKGSLDAQTTRDEPATAGERTPGSPGSASGHPDGHSNALDTDTLNTPVSTAKDVPTFFPCTVSSISDPVPITGKGLFDLFNPSSAYFVQCLLLLLYSVSCQSVEVQLKVSAKLAPRASHAIRCWCICKKRAVVEYEKEAL